MYNYTPNNSHKNPLAEGVVGREIVAYFASQGIAGVPVDAVSLGGTYSCHTYEITFDNGWVGTYDVVFSSDPTSCVVTSVVPVGENTYIGTNKEEENNV